MPTALVSRTARRAGASFPVKVVLVLASLLLITIAMARFEAVIGGSTMIPDGEVLSSF